jgi:hypothetical protein
MFFAWPISTHSRQRSVARFGSARAAISVLFYIIFAASGGYKQAIESDRRRGLQIDPTPALWLYRAGRLTDQARHAPTGSFWQGNYDRQAGFTDNALYENPPFRAPMASLPGLPASFARSRLFRTITAHSYSYPD